MDGVNQEIHGAVLRGNLKAVKKLLKLGSNINQTNRHGKTPLHIALRNGQENVIEYLMNHGADVEKANPDGQTPLHLAASLGLLKATKCLLSNGANMDKEDKDGYSAWYSAVRYGHLDIVQYFISQGAKVNQVNTKGWTPLYIAAGYGYIEIVKYLISQGAEVNKGVNDGRTAFHSAAKRGHLDVTRYLINQGAEVNKGDNGSWTEFHSAAKGGHLGVTRYLISLGAEVNKGDNDGWTALNLAAHEGQLDIAKYLISQGAEVNKGNNDGRTAFHSDANRGHLDVTKYLISHRGWTALNLAAQEGQLDLTRHLINQRAEVNKGDNEGWTALHLAAQEGQLDVTGYLISQGAEVNGGNDEGITAFHSAANRGHLDVTRYLINQGAKVNKGANDGTTAFHRAAKNGHLDVTKYLISHGAEVNKGDNNGWTALNLAAHEGHLDITRYLISLGAEVNKGNNVGATAFHSAARSGHLSVTKYLISQEAEVNEGGNDGWTALNLAAHEGQVDVIKYLISEGAEVNKGNNVGSTAIHSAASQGHLDVTRYLISQRAEVNRGGNVGTTALHRAVQNGHLDVVRALMAGGAQFDKKDIHGQTPLHLSLILGYGSIADLFRGRSIYKLDQNDLTDIHFAIQHGHTSTIEKLISEGADLNIQSPDGQMCLHEAIKLCNTSEKIVEQTDTLRKISDEYYRGELSPKRALVFYLLENGARVDVRDERGNLPIQYAKDEVVKQMLLSRLPSFEEIKSHRDEPPTPAIISVEVKSDTSQEIELEDHGVSMFIPPEAVHQSDRCKIVFSLLRDLPSVDIQDYESVACYGIRCDPPNMIFHQPVKIRIPHSTLTINPDQVKPDIVSHFWDSVNDLPRTSRMISSSSPDEPPYCRVYKRHLELYIGHCAEWWVLIPLVQQVIRHQLMCTPYIPDTIERGKEIEVHLHIHANLPGMDAEVQEAEKKQSYHKVHPSIPISIATKSGDVQVICCRQEEFEQRKSGQQVLSQKDIQSKLKHSFLLPVTSREENTDFPVIITITQAGMVGVSLTVAFLIRYSDDLKQESSLVPFSFVGVVEEVSSSDLEDIDVHTIAEKMTVDQFYDLGIALGFRIQQLDNIEYRRFRDRQQATYDMLVKWRQAQASGQQAKETFLSLMKSLDSPAEQLEMTDIGSAGEVSDKTILAFSREIKPEQFSEIGGKLGLKKAELEHIQHRTLSNRKDANIQMLSKWKASQTSGNEAIQTLKLVWESVKAVPNVEKLEDEGSSRKLELTPVEKTKPNEPSSEPEDMEIIVTSACDDVLSVTPGKHSESPQDLDRHGGVPDTEELCSVALSVKNLSTACSLGKALRINDDLIVGSIDLPSSSILHKIARELVDSWRKGLKKEEREDEFTKLLSEYNIPDVKTESTIDTMSSNRLDACNRHSAGMLPLNQISVQRKEVSIAINNLKASKPSGPDGILPGFLKLAGREKISKAIGSMTDLVDLCHRLNVKPSGVLQIMSKFVTFPPHMIGRCTLKMLKKWVHQGGTRERLLEIAQAFRFNDAAVKIAEAMKCQRSCIPFLSHGIIDHKGEELTLDELGIAVSIPEGAIPKGMRSVVTLRVSTHDTPRLPVREGEVVITPVVECSLTQELLKPATVVLPHCTNHHERSDDSPVMLYTRTGPGTCGRRTLTPSQISKDRITFCTRHLQVWALSSTDLQGLQLRCVVFQPVFMTPAERPTLRVYLLHPYMNRVEDITRKEKSSSAPYCQVMKEFTFSIESEARDLKILFDDGTKRKERTMPIKSILSGKCSPLNFELQFSPEEKGKKNGHIDILQGSAIRAEKEFFVSKEDKPDYGVDQTDSHGRLQYVSNNLLEILADLIHTPKDVISLGYQLGLSYSSMKKYNDPADVYLNSVSRSGFGNMLRDWRRQVRPSQQVDELHLALQNAGLGHAADVILHELSSRRRFAQVKQGWESKK